MTPVSSTADTIQQSIYFVDKKDKRSLLLHVLKGSEIPTALVFTRTKHGADKVAQGLARAVDQTFAIAIVNLIVLRSIYRAFVRVRRGEPYMEEDFDLLLGNRGLLSRLFRPVFRMITRSWHMYPLGLLFGLGFDTATEIGVLGISAAEASKGLSFGAILVFPVLFIAGIPFQARHSEIVEFWFENIVHKVFDIV